MTGPGDDAPTAPLTEAVRPPGATVADPTVTVAAAGAGAGDDEDDGGVGDRSRRRSALLAVALLLVLALVGSVAWLAGGADDDPLVQVPATSTTTEPATTTTITTSVPETSTPSTTVAPTTTAPTLTAPPAPEAPDPTDPRPSSPSRNRTEGTSPNPVTRRTRISRPIPCLIRDATPTVERTRLIRSRRTSICGTRAAGRRPRPASGSSPPARPGCRSGYRPMRGPCSAKIQCRPSQSAAV